MDLLFCQFKITIGRIRTIHDLLPNRFMTYAVNTPVSRQLVLFNTDLPDLIKQI